MKPGPIGTPLLALIIVLPASAATQQRADSWVGKRVVTKFGTDLKDGKFTVDAERRESRAAGGQRRAARVYKVAEADGSSLRLVPERDGRGGWAKVAEVVPFDKAVAYYDGEIKKRGKIPELYDARGAIFYEMRQYDRALADFDRALRLDPENEVFLTNRGTVHLANEDYDRAVADFTAAIRHDPNYALPRNNRGLARRALKELDEAIADFTEAIRLDPDAPRSRVNRGLAYHDARDFARAVADFDEAIRRDAQDAAAFNDRAITRAAQGNYREALADLDEAIRLDPGFAWAHNNRAWVLATCPQSSYRDAKKAVESAEIACKLTDETDTAKLSTLAAAHAAAGDFATAVARQEQALALKPTERDRREFQRRLSLYKDGRPYRPGFGE